MARSLFARPEPEAPAAESDALGYFIDGLIKAREARTGVRALRAAGLKIAPTINAEQLRAVAGRREGWQTTAWGYRDAIAELRFALQFRARALSRARFYVAQITDDDDEPIPLSLRDEKGEDGKPSERAEKVTVAPALAEAAEAVLRRLPLDAGYAFLGAWVENWDVSGECWLYGRTDPLTGEDVWAIHSVDDIVTQGATIAVKDDLDQPRAVDLDNEEIYRFWVPHPHKRVRADSALNAMSSVLENILLLDRELRATARSRIGTNGLLLMPEGMLERRNTKTDSEGAPVDPADAFMDDFTAAMLAPISNEGDAGAVAPMMLTGHRDDIAAVRHLKLEREGTPDMLAKLDRALGRMATGLDIPPEILTGLGGTNHWSAWQIDGATFRHHLEPTLRMIADSLTGAYLRTVLAADGFGPDEVKTIRVWYDAGQITENPNRRQDAIDARKELAIGDAAFRKALGFNDGDAPSAEEVMRMIAAKTGLDQAAASAIFKWYAEQAGSEAAVALGEAETAKRETAQRIAAPELPPAAGPGQPPGGPPPSAVTAAGLPSLWRVDLETGRELVEIDRALREQVLAAADAHMGVVVARAGSRLRSKLQADKTVFAAYRPHPVEQWGAMLGREQALAFGADRDYLLAKAWDELEGRFRKWAAAAVDRVADKVLGLLGLRRGGAGRQVADRIRLEMGSRTDQAWTVLETALDDHAEKLVFGEQDPTARRGEDDGGSVPAWPVRAALSVIGGAPEDSAGTARGGRPVDATPVNGLGNGTTVTGVLSARGVVPLGYTWMYGTAPRSTFHPHLDLDKERFEGWTDPVLSTAKWGAAYSWVGPFFRPGDHGGCRCDFAMGYAVPDAPVPPVQPQPAAEDDSIPYDPQPADFAQQVRDRLSVPSPAMADILMLAEGDDRAGRKGTTAQETREQWRRVQALNRDYLEGRL